MALPVVKPEVGLSIQRDLLEARGDEYLGEMVDRLGGENIVVLHFLEKFVKTTRDPKGSLYAGLLVYRMLEVQQEADDLTKSDK